MATKFTLIIKTENAAFHEDGPGLELARLLRAVAQKIENGAETGVCMDVNGNFVGRFQLK